MNNSTLSGAAASTETPAQPHHHDDVFFIAPDTSRLDALDLLLRKITQLRDLCNTCSNPGDEAVHGVFWFMADTLQCCEQLADRVFKATAAAEHGAPDATPEQTAPVDTKTTEPNVHNDPLADYVAMPLAHYEKLGLAIETLRAQALIASDPDTRQCFNERTLDGLGNAVVYEIDRISDLIAGCKTLRNPD